MLDMESLIELGYPLVDDLSTIICYDDAWYVEPAHYILPDKFLYLLGRDQG